MGKLTRWGWSSEIVVLAVLVLVVTLAWQMPRPQTPTPFLTREGAGSMIVGAEGLAETGGSETARVVPTAEDANSITATDIANQASAAGPDTPKSSSAHTGAAPNREQSGGSDRNWVFAAGRTAATSPKLRSASLDVALERERQRTAELSKALAQASQHASDLQAQLATADTAIRAAQTRDRQASVEESVDTGRGLHRRLKAQLDVAHRAVASLQVENARLRERVHGGDVEQAAIRQRDDASVAAANGEVAKLKVALDNAAKQVDRRAKAERAASNRADILQSKVAALQARIDVYTIESALLPARIAVLASSQRAAEAERSTLQAENTRLQDLVARRARERLISHDGGNVIRAATEGKSAAPAPKDAGAAKAGFQSPQLEEPVSSRVTSMNSLSEARPRTHASGPDGFAIELLARHQELISSPLMTVGRLPDEAFSPGAKCVHPTTQDELADGRWRSRDGILALSGGRFQAAD